MQTPLSFDALTLSQHTRRFRSGTPFATGAVVKVTPDGGAQPHSSLPYFSVACSDKSTKFVLKLKTEDRVFGLGQMLGALNKRGKRYRLFAKDDPSHTPDKSSLYGSHPFCIIQGAHTFGFFIDFPGEIIFDVGFRDKDHLEITVASADFDFYLFEHWDVRQIIREYLDLTGAPFLPPRWAFGYQQCRYSYPNAESVRSVAEHFRNLDIPCDAIYMDIDYMQEYKVFTVDEEKFPHFPAFVSELRRDGFQLIPIIDPGVKIESGDPAYQSGLAAQAFCVNEDGTPFVGAVWPGLVHFPDFLNARCREWWGSLYKRFTDIGINHFWNDMNEPAIFYTPTSLNLLKDMLHAVEGRTDFGTGAVDFISSLGSFWQNEHDLRSIFHTLDDGRKINHYDVHNLYGTSMVRATTEGLARLNADKRSFVVGRSSYPGLHRYAVLWTGDNSSWWEHMLVQLRMVLSLNMAGFFYCGGDVGGFGGDSSPELCVRWTQLGCFTPLFRNHSTKGSRAQEPWAFDSESLGIMRNFIRVRYAMLPFIYSEYRSAVEHSSPFISPLFLHFGDEAVKEIEDQFMFGSALMVAPVLTQNAHRRFVYLPECRWLQWNIKAWDRREVQVRDPGSYFIAAPLDELPVFLRENSLLPLTEPRRHCGEAISPDLVVIAFVTKQAAFTLIHDDGESLGFSRGETSRLHLSVTKNGDHFSPSVRAENHAACPLPYKKVFFEIYDGTGKLHRLEQQIV